MDYQKLAYEALQRVSVSTIWSEDAIQRVANYLETTIKKTAHSNDYARCSKCEAEYEMEELHCLLCDSYLISAK